MAIENTGLLFLQRAAATPERPAIRGDAFLITYGQLRDIVISLALNLLDRGVGQRAVVAARSDDPIVVFSTVFATALTGSTWVNAQPTLLEAAAVQPDIVLVGGDVDSLPEGTIRLDPGWALPPLGYRAGQKLQFPGFIGPDDTWLLKPTSGTTGTPKLVPISHAVAARRFAATADIVRFPGAGVTGLFPPSASALLTRYPCVLLHGGTIVHSADPATWLAAGVELVVGSPSQIQTCLEGVTLPQKIGRVHASGGKLPDRVVHELAQSFTEVANGYGSTETNNCLSNLKQIAADGSVMTTTRLREGVTIEIVDGDDQPVASGREGIIRVKTPYLASTYLNAPDAAAAAFRDGWFYPGDLGLWTTDGEFVVSGRGNDQFNVGGVKVNALLLDAALQSVPGIQDAMCFMVPLETGDRLTAFISLAPNASPTGVLAEARIAVSRLAGAAVVPEKFLFAQKLPRNSNGKPDRRACLAMVQASKSRG